MIENQMNSVAEVPIPLYDVLFGVREGRSRA